MTAPAELRILTVRQPWAHAIVSLGKDVENRSRNIAGAYRGPIAIHAAKHRLTIDEDLAAGSVISHLSGYFPLFTLPAGLGSILGVVDIVGAHNCPVVTCDAFAGEAQHICSEWAEAASWHLVLANARPLAEPIPYKGALGLRTLPNDVAAQVWAGVAA